MSNYEKFKKICEEIPRLIAAGVVHDDPEFIKWHTKSERFLRKHFGEGSAELSSFKSENFFPLGRSCVKRHEDCVMECQKKLRQAQAEFQVYLEEMEESEESVEILKQASSKEEKDYKSVFIVHGHNEKLKLSVARLIERQGLEAVILHEQPNQGATIIEKFEQNSNVGAAICLFTSDDIGRGKKENEEKNRARQNVVFEAGFFMGKLGRKHVIIIYEQGVELPSDMQGIAYTENWEFGVLKELKGIGYEIDLNKLA